MSTDLVQFRKGIVDLLPRLRRFTFSLTSDRDDGDDLAQATVERALQKAELWDSSKKLDLWLFRIAKNMWIDQYRSDRAKGQILDLNMDSEKIYDETEASNETKLLVEQVMKQIQLLPDDQRLVLNLVAIEGYSYKDTAKILEIPIGTVMSRLSRARATLASELKS